MVTTVNILYVSRYRSHNVQILNAFVDCISYVNSMTNWHCNAFSMYKYVLKFIQYKNIKETTETLQVAFIGFIECGTKWKRKKKDFTTPFSFATICNLIFYHFFLHCSFEKFVLFFMHLLPLLAT